MFSWKHTNRSVPKGKAGQRVYAVGDIHGCLKETLKLLERIKAHNDYRDGMETYLVFLGDIVDRGPESRGVVELLQDFPYTFAEPLFIMGNHEEMMVRALTGRRDLLPEWLKYGGYECAESYGLPRKKLERQDPEALEYMLKSAIPEKHIDFLASFVDYVQCGDFFFTHAGIRPGVSISRQDPREFRWIREPFLSYKGDHGVVVVHGHTIADQIQIRANRIGIDTGVYESGRLSAVCIEHEQTFFLDNL